MKPPPEPAPSKRTTVRPLPSLEALRAELGDAVVEARLVEARKREEQVRRLPPVERAARTIFLNRTCFNGLYRVNRHGLFNVPYGPQAHTTFLHPPAIRAAHRALQGVEVLCEDFGACAGRARAGDFVYLDPPYPVGLNSGPSFRYQALGFGREDQLRVAALFRLLDARGYLVMASNADTPLTREAYAGYPLEAFAAARGIGGRGVRRGRAPELLARKYAGRRGALPGLAG